MEPYLRKSREERRDEIYQAATAVFLQKGYKNTTMEDLIAATSLSKGGFYHYYSSPREVLLDIMRYSTQQVILGNNFILDLNAPKEQLCQTLTAMLLERILRSAPEQKLFLMFVIELAHDPECQRLFLELEQAAIAMYEQLLQHRVQTSPPGHQQQLKLFLSRLVTMLMLSQQLFGDQALITGNRELLANLLYPIIEQVIE